MFNMKYCAFIGLLGVLSFLTVGTKSGPPNNIEKFGPFCITTRSVDVCSLPGPVDTENQCIHNMAVYKINRVQEVFRGKVEVPHDLVNISSFVSADLWRDGGYKPFFSKTNRKSCEGGLISFFIKTFFKVDKSCIIQKGNYTIDVNPTEMMKEVIGNNFFYEKISLTLAWYTNKGIVCCVKLACETKPLPKRTQLYNRYNNRTRNMNALLHNSSV